MPFVSGSLQYGWAIIDVLVHVNRRRRRLLEKHRFSIPEAVPVRALIDTGASISGFAPRVFRALDLTPVSNRPVLTPSTPPDRPHDCDFYDVLLSLVAGGSAHAFPDMLVMEADCWMPQEGIEALIGMDILSHCFFQLRGLDRQFTLAF